jgi:hypothetical protein
MAISSKSAAARRRRYISDGRGEVMLKKRLSLLFSTGWGHLGVVAGACWIAWRWKVVDDDAGAVLSG